MKRIILFSLLFISAAACDKIGMSTIPYAPVYIPIDVQFTDLPLRNPLGYKNYITKRYASEQLGYGGVVVVHGFSSGEMDSYPLFAYDMACPHEADRSSIILMGKNGIATCHQCSTIYDLSWGYGNIISGPSKYPLVRYRVIYKGGSKYEVVN